MNQNIKRPIVKTGMRTREGRGYSLNELKAAGLSLLDAKRIGLFLDKRRKTTHSENVEYLKTIELKK